MTKIDKLNCVFFLEHWFRGILSFLNNYVWKTFPGPKRNFVQIDVEIGSHLVEIFDQNGQNDVCFFWHTVYRFLMFSQI